jgi:Domain of unknown function (DUF5753)
VTLIDHENTAAAISGFEPTLVPGLLQTGDYARALLKQAGRVSAEEIDDRVAARLTRQSLFSRERPARFTFYLHEFCLRLPVGGPAVMADQLQHLERMSLRPYLTLRVVPTSLGAHAATAGSFRLMEFAEFKPVVTWKLSFQPVPGKTRGDRGLPGHPYRTGRDCSERERIQEADWHPGN